MPRGLLPLVAALLLASSQSATASTDYGPGSAVRAIRHDLPLLLANALGSGARSYIDWIVANHREAVAMWHSGHNAGLVILRNHAGQWWWHAAAVTTMADRDSWTDVLSPGDIVTSCGDSWPQPTAHQLFQDGYVSESLAERLAKKLTKPPPSRLRALTICDYAPNYVRDWQGTYDALFVYDRKMEIGWVIQLAGRSEEYEREPASGAKPYYLFDLWSEARKPLTFPAGSTLTVWFPYVVSAKSGFRLSLINVKPEVHTSAELIHNAVHFQLPSFTLPAYGAAHGEIDGPE